MRGHLRRPGHDEYWDQANYSAVSTAKDDGVNLAFFSGNEVFWRTELQPQHRRHGSANRTVTSYKMTKMEEAQPDGVADPSGQWTGTWMDPNGAATGSAPQNQLTGTQFSVNGYRSDAITVSYPYRPRIACGATPPSRRCSQARPTPCSIGTPGL